MPTEHPEDRFTYEDLTKEELRELEKLAKEKDLFLPWLIGGLIWKKNHKDCEF